MSELDKIREDLDDLRGRITMLEMHRQTTKESAGSAIRAAEAADRQLVTSRSEWRAVVDGLETKMSQILSLLSAPDACLPARRPENTQSARDRPLT